MKLLHTLPCLCLALTFACSSNAEEPAKKPAPAADKDAKDTKDAKDEPVAAKDGAPEGYEAYLVQALDELAAGGAVAMAESQPYGCGVKYSDPGGEVTAKVGEAAPTFNLKDTAGNEVSLADFKGKTVVLEWFNPDCPFVVYAHGDGPLSDMAQERLALAKGEVVWLAVNSGASGKQGHGAERNEKARGDWKLDHPVLLDEDGAVGHMYGAKTTPQMFVVNPEGVLVYAGGLDNAPMGEVRS